VRIIAQLRRYQRPSTNDWVGAGTIWAEEPAIAPGRAHADAVGATAAAHGNLTEDATRPFGDHPFGLYEVAGVVWSSTDPERQLYGPVRLRLEPIAGQALEAKKNGRTGLAIHGGPTREGQLRATLGCLRVDDDTAVALATAVEAELQAGRAVGYACEEIA
jgi:hypothetical protein